MATCSDRAWNNFVMRSKPASFEIGSNKRTAAIASLFLSGANNGGLNSFLTSTYDLDAGDVLDALVALGATKAAQQLDMVLQSLGTTLPSSSQEERWEVLDRHWSVDLDRYDALSEGADEELKSVLSAHVAENEELYSRLD